MNTSPRTDEALRFLDTAMSYAISCGSLPDYVIDDCRKFQKSIWTHRETWRDAIDAQARKRAEKETDD